jgi:hypothetical protein
VTAIALEAGFADCAHFSRQFHEFFGINLSDVRKADPPGRATTLLAEPRSFSGEGTALIEIKVTAWRPCGVDLLHASKKKGARWRTFSSAIRSARPSRPKFSPSN